MDKDLREFLGVDKHIDPFDGKPYFGFFPELDNPGKQLKDMGALGEIRQMAWEAVTKCEALARYFNVKFVETDITDVHNKGFYHLEKND